MNLENTYVLKKEGSFWVLYEEEETRKKWDAKLFGRKKPDLKTFFCLEELEFQAARAFLVRKLVRQSGYSSLLKKDLISLGVKESIAEKAVALFVEMGVVNDREYIEAYKRRSKAKNEGVLKLKTRLYQKGIAFHEEPSEEEEVANLEALFEKKRFSLEDLQVRDLKQKCIQFFIRKGFQFSTIKKVFIKKESLLNE